MPAKLSLKMRCNVLPSQLTRLMWTIKQTNVWVLLCNDPVALMKTAMMCAVQASGQVVFAEMYLVA